MSNPNIYTIFGILCVSCVFAENYSIITQGFIEIGKALPTSSLTILAPKRSDHILEIDVFMKEAHRSNLPTTIFTDVHAYLSFILKCHTESIQTSSLILADPMFILSDLLSRNLGHRINLFMFYWNSKNTNYTRPRSPICIPEPIRVVIITRPRPHCLDVFYNQADPEGLGQFKKVNWFDADDLGLVKMPLLPSPTMVYRKFNGRVLTIPVIHSPPWNFVEYHNETSNSTNRAQNSDNQDTARVVGGRDFNLLKLLGQHMNFKIVYIDPAERTQGAVIFDSFYYNDNLTFSGGLGLIQRREADLLLGDVTITWERSKAVEFSFFTLADSGAFATHARKRLNEALVLVRPFRWEVWPLLLFTIAISGPAFYVIIAVPFWWQNQNEIRPRKAVEIKERLHGRPRLKIKLDRNPLFIYTKEMSYGIRDVKAFNHNMYLRKLQKHSINRPPSNQLPQNLLGKCIWFTLTLFLKQSCNELYPGKRAKFLSTILWIATTYVLADVYSAQLTSQLARPAREPPINNLHQLETAMKTKGYQLFVERESSSFSALENGTEIFKRLFTLMKHQAGSKLGNEHYLVSSVEEGVSQIMDGSKKVILGGRETLFFNMKRHGFQNFQLSEKLFTRYSAVAVQTGCLFIEPLNDVLIHLFEGGIMEKMTNTEYELMIKLGNNKSTHEILNTNNGPKTAQQISDESKIQPINLRTLQGAFIVLCIGYVLAGFVLWIETNIKLINCLHDNVYNITNRVYIHTCKAITAFYLILKRYYQKLIFE